MGDLLGRKVTIISELKQEKIINLKKQIRIAYYFNINYNKDYRNKNCGMPYCVRTTIRHAVFGHHTSEEYRKVNYMLFFIFIQ